MYYEELAETMDKMLQEGKGILAADESNGTIGKRFASIQVENTEQNRRDYRLLLAEAPGLEEYVNGVILYAETFSQKDDAGNRIVDLFAKKGIVPGIKVDQGLVNFMNIDSQEGDIYEQVTEGLDGLYQRVVNFREQGARFAKWRCVYSISSHTPSLAAVKAGAENLARYAAICQSAGVVPIVEPEVLMDGDHSIEHCAEVSELVLHELFRALFIYQVDLQLMILKPSMVTCGKAVKPFSEPEEVADFTIQVFRNNVPAAVPAINFLSGGQTPQQATANLNAMNQIGHQPWLLSFSYGRALQEDCLKIWGGKPENVTAAQAALVHRAKMNSLACLGKYNAKDEK